MYKHSLYLQGMDRFGAIYGGLLRTASTADYDEIRVAVAYVTKEGCRRVANGFGSTLPRWESMDKRWLTSFDLGVTEPAALEFLSSLPNSEVRIAGAERALSAHLRPSIHFHTKLYLLACHDSPDCKAIFSTSANLTENGLYFNAEQATASVWSPPLDRWGRLQLARLRQETEFMDQMFAEAAPLNGDLLDRYRRLWKPNRAREVESGIASVVIQPHPVVGLTEAVTLATARSFWVRVTDRVVPNLGDDRPGNQVDLQRGSRAFFLVDIREVLPNTQLGEVSIRFEGEVSVRGMRFGNNGMDKINLPPLEYPRTYARQTLLFERLGEGVFDLTIGTPRQASRWRKLSETQGTLYTMKSGREYGVFT